MLDLWFGLDASGFDNASTSLFIPSLPSFSYLFLEYSAIPPYLRAISDGHLRLPEQYTTPYWYVLSLLVFQRAIDQ